MLLYAPKMPKIFDSMSIRPGVELGHCWHGEFMAYDEHAMDPHNPYHFGTAAAGTHAPPAERFFGVQIPRDGERPKDPTENCVKTNATPSCLSQNSWD